jgi:AcrR family transcriptional regulator
MVRDGVRGVRHRAVALEADVPLSATTYYFKDIHDLLADALTLYAKDVMDNVVNPFWVRIREWLFVNYPLYSGTNLQEHLPKIAEHVVDVAIDDVVDRLNNHRDALMTEQAFWYAVLQDERLHPLALDYRASVHKDVTQMLELIGVEDPVASGRIILMTIRHLELDGLLKPVGGHDREAMKRLLMHQVRAICRF